jgi:hypothetical protein
MSFKTFIKQLPLLFVFVVFWLSPGLCFVAFYFPEYFVRLDLAACDFFCCSIGAGHSGDWFF